MLGALLADGIDAATLRDDLLGRGLIVNAPRPDTIRLLPPFVVTDGQIDSAIELIEGALSVVR